MSSCRIMTKQEREAERHRWDKILQRVFTIAQDPRKKREDAALMRHMPHALAVELLHIEAMKEKYGRAGRTSSMPRKDKINKRFFEIIQSRHYRAALKAANCNRPGLYRP